MHNLIAQGGCFTEVGTAEAKLTKQQGGKSPSSVLSRITYALRS